MISTIEELFLSEYFLIQAILGKFLVCSKDLFFNLGNIFLLSDTKIYLFYRLSEREDVKDIKTENDFKRYQRIKQYLQMNGSKNSFNEEVEHIKNIKGNSILTATELKLMSDSEATQNTIYSTVANAANLGIIPALRIMGLLQCEGISVEKNLKEGVLSLSKSADWNDILSILALLKYCTNTREYNMARLKMLVKGTPFISIYSEAVKQYKIYSDDEVNEVKLLEKAFNYSMLKREMYEPKYARIISSENLRFEEKERLIICESKEVVSIVSDLPLNLPKCELRQMDFSALRQIHLFRDDEQEMILKNFKNADLVGQDTYYPLCLCSDTKYLLNMYAEAVSKILGINVHQINVSELTEYDLEPTLNNIFVRNINKNQVNCFLLYCKGNIRSEILDYIINFLKASNRANFHLNKPNITIDFSNVLPICCCDESNFDALKHCCEVVKLKDISDDEMLKAIEHIILNKKKLYGISEIKLQKEIVDKLHCKKIEEIEKLLDYAVRGHRGETGRIEIAETDLKFNLDTNKSNKIGFGFGGN